MTRLATGSSVRIDDGKKACLEPGNIAHPTAFDTRSCASRIQHKTFESTK
jgi:hypothetical protein